MELTLYPAHRTKASPGLIDVDRKALSLPEGGGWVSIRFGKKEVRKRADEMEGQAGWQPRVIHLPLKVQKALGLPDGVRTSSAAAPFTGAPVIVRKLLFPRERKVYLTIATLILAVATALVTYFKPIPGQNATELVLASLTAVVGAVAAAEQKQ